MITARELVFYIRAEDQASRVVKRAARNIGSLSNIKNLQGRLDEQQLQNLRKVAQAQQAIRRNEEAILRARVQQSKLDRYLARGRPMRGLTMKETEMLSEAATKRVETFTRQQQLLAGDLDEVRRKGAAASAALEQQISQAKISRVHDYANAFSNLARSIRLIGAIAAASLGFAAHQAAAFGEQVMLAATQARPPGASSTATVSIAGKIQDEILDQMKEFPAASQDMAAAMYEIFSSTDIENVDKAGRLLREFNRASVAGAVPLQEMSDAGITLLNNFVGKDREFKNITQALNAFFATVREGRMSAGQFAGSLSNVVAVGIAAGLTFRDIGDAMATLTRQTGSKVTGRDATGLARLIETLGKPEVIEGLAGIGVEAIDPITKKMRPLLQIITEIQERADIRGVNALNFFKTISAVGDSRGNQSTIQARRAFSFLIKDLELYQRVSNKIAKVTNVEFQRSYEAMAQAPGVEWRVLMNQLKALTIVIGREAIPAIVLLTEPLVSLLEWFNNLSDETKRYIALALTFGSAIAIVGGTLAIAASGVLKLILTLKMLKLSKLAAEAGFVRGRFALWLGVITLIIATLPVLIKLLGSTENAITVLSIALSAGFAAKTISGLRNANGQLGTLKGTMVGLRFATLGTVAAVVYLGYELSNIIRQIPYWDNLFKGLGTVIYDATHGGQGKPTPSSNVMQGQIQAITQAAQEAWDLGMTIESVRVRVKYLFRDFEDQHALDVWLNHAINNINEFENALKNSGIQAALAPPTVSTPSGQANADLIFTDREFIKRLEQVHRLQVEYEKAPNLTAAMNAWRVYHKALDALNSDATANQKEMINDLLAGIQDAASKALSNSVILQMSRQAEEVKAAAEKTADPKLWEKYYSIQEDLQEKAVGNQLAYADSVISSEQNIHDQRVKLAEDAAKRQEQNVQNAKQAIEAAYGGLQGMYETLLDQNKSLFGDLFQGPVVAGARVQNSLQFGGSVGGVDLLSDIKAQVFAFKRINQDLNKLEARGAPKAFLDQIRALGPEGKVQIKALQQLTPKQFREYVRAWNAGQAAIKSNTMRQLNSQLRVYESHGKRIALAILRGIRSEDVNLQNALRQTILDLFPGLAGQAGMNRGNGVRPSIPGQVSGSNHYHTHYEIKTTAQPHDVKTQVKHADFIARNKYRVP